MKEVCNTAANAEDKREKIQALSLAKECYSMKLELLTNATVVNGVIRFVSTNGQPIQSRFWGKGYKIWNKWQHFLQNRCFNVPVGPSNYFFIIIVENKSRYYNECYCT